MGWLSKIFKGPKRKFRDGHYDCGHGTKNTMGNNPLTSQNSWSETEHVDCAISISLSEEDQKGKDMIDRGPQLKEDELLARSLQESLQVESQPEPWGRNVNGYGYGYEYEYNNLYQPITFPHSTGFRICASCNTEIGHGRFLNCMNAVWHPECFRCKGCHQPISDHEFSVSGSYPYHKACYKEAHYPKCDICRHLIPTNAAGLIEYRAHPFWSQKYCPKHEHDGTPRCCSCERMESWDVRFSELNDNRKLCPECLNSAVMDTKQCQPLLVDIHDFFKGLNMKIAQNVPLLLVEKQALNEAMGGEKHGHHHMPETRGLCLSEEQTVSTRIGDKDQQISRRMRIGSGSRVRNEPYKLTRHCEVTAILILYGLPRLLTGTILAHEMMHAWMRLNGYQNLRQEVEEGICQVIAGMWLESQILSMNMSDGNGSSTSSPFEQKLSKFYKHQIATDTSAVYGDGFRIGYQAVLRFGLEDTLDHMRKTGNFPN